MDFGLRVIGLVGASRSGKDSYAKAVKEHMSQFNKDKPSRVTQAYDIRVLSFASYLKEDIKLIVRNRYSNNFVTSDEGMWPSEYRVKMKKVWREYGNKVAKEVMGEEVFIDALIKDLKGITISPAYFRFAIITDVRFSNEYYMLRDLFDASFIRIEKPQSLWEKLKDPYLLTKLNKTDRELRKIKMPKVINNYPSIYSWQEASVRDFRERFIDPLEGI